MVRVRPESSGVPTTKSSYIALGVDLATFGTGFGLAFAQENLLWTLVSTFQFAPTANIFYKAEYTDAKGKVRHEDLRVSYSAWFQPRDTLQARLLERAPQALSAELFGAADSESAVPLRAGRFALDFAPLIYARSNHGLVLDAHLEKFLPHSVTVDVSPGIFIPFSIPESRYSIYAGPRLYFLGGHAGLFIGVEPYFEGSRSYGQWNGRVALPVTFGFVSQAERIVLGLDFGVGPAWTLAGAYAHDYVEMGNLYLGFAF